MGEIIEKLDTLIEQVRLTNALMMASVMSDQSKFKLLYDWRDMENLKCSEDEASEHGKRQRLIPLALYRIVDDEAQ